MTNQQRKEVMKLHYEGYSYAQLAEKYGVCQSTIREIIKKNEAAKLNKKQ